MAVQVGLWAVGLVLSFSHRVAVRLAGVVEVLAVVAVEDSAALVVEILVAVVLVEIIEKYFVI